LRNKLGSISHDEPLGRPTAWGSLADKCVPAKSILRGIGRVSTAKGINALITNENKMLDG
jgi:hypothetical protein